MNAREFDSEKFARFHPGGHLGKRLIGKVRDFMVIAEVVDCDESFKNVLLKISESQIGVICVSRLNQVIGVITDGDIRRYLSSHEITEVLSCKASDLASLNPRNLTDEARCIDADALMAAASINSLLVFDSTGKPHFYQNLNRR
jgi:arabinose-5-phosphate isomerase